MTEAMPALVFPPLAPPLPFTAAGAPGFLADEAAAKLRSWFMTTSGFFPSFANLARTLFALVAVGPVNVRKSSSAPTPAGRPAARPDSSV